jgi:hypothetical protein
MHAPAPAQDLVLCCSNLGHPSLSLLNQCDAYIYAYKSSLAGAVCKRFSAVTIGVRKAKSLEPKDSTPGHLGSRSRVEPSCSLEPRCSLRLCGGPPPSPQPCPHNHTRTHDTHAYAHGSQASAQLVTQESSTRARLVTDQDGACDSDPFCEVIIGGEVRISGRVYEVAKQVCGILVYLAAILVYLAAIHAPSHSW